MRQNLLRAIETLRRLYYLTQNLFGEGQKHIEALRRYGPELPDEKIQEALESVQADVDELKKLVGCKLSDEEINRAVEWLTSVGEGYPSLPKRHIDRGFDNYARVFPRWPHVPGHAYVQFDSNIEGKSPLKIFVPEERLFRDVKLLWGRISHLTSDGKTFRTREDSAQQDLSSYMRLAAAAIYHFLESYVNGIAYNCFQDFHPGMDIEDHDLLAEWDSGVRRTHFVSLERKLKEYPRICGKYLKRDVNLEGDPDVAYLLGEGKLLRDALTHPSPYINFESDKPTKMQMIAGITPEQIRQLL